MKSELSSVDIYFLIKELKNLESARIDKIFQLSLKEFVFRIHTKEGKKQLRLLLPGLIYISDRYYETPETPPNFCTFLRKYISGAIIKKIEQKAFEKIIVLTLIAKNEEIKLIIELIKPGNLILVKEDQILSPLTSKRFKDRTIKAKLPYEFPPEQINTPKLKEKDIQDILSTSKKPLVKSLATELALGGKYAEEIISRTMGDSPGDIAKQVTHLFKDKLNPITTKNDAFPIKVHTTEETKEFKSFSEALDSFKEEKKIVLSKEEKKHMGILESQKKTIRKLEKEIKDSQKAGEYIYENYQDFLKLLDNVKELKKTKSYKEIKELLKKNKHFKDLNEKEKKIILEF